MPRAVRRSARRHCDRGDALVEERGAVDEEGLAVDGKDGIAAIARDRRRVPGGPLQRYVVRACGARREDGKREREDDGFHASAGFR